MNKKQQIAYYRKAWLKVQGALSAFSFGQYPVQYLDLIVKGEKQHRKGKPEGVTCGLTLSEACEYFAVHNIVRALLPSNWKPTIKDYLYVRQDVLCAYSLVENYRDEIEKALKDFDLQVIDKIDYAELMR